MEIGRDEMGSENGKENGVKLANTTPPVTEIKFDDIPSWILTEVLITLPMKLVFRSKLVSKHWLSAISDPSFVFTYTSRASKLPRLQRWTFISGTMYVDGSEGWDFSKYQLLGDVYSREISSSSLYVLRCPSADQHLDTKMYRILGVSNGLVLYGPCIERECIDSIVNYSICNPITRQWITLPPHARHFKIVNNGFVTRVENGVLTSYRIVRFDMFFRKSNTVTFEVFSSEIGEWKEFDVYIDQEIQVVWPSHTSLNGILHWITRKNGIIAYNPYHNPHYLRVIALPCDVQSRTQDTTHIDVHQGRLKYFKIADVFMNYSYRLSSISVWVLNDYSTGDWSLQHRFSSSDILYDDIIWPLRLLKPISFHPFDSDIVYFGFENKIVSYNIKTRKMEARGNHVRDKDPMLENNIWPCWSSTFLFVVPPWPVYIPRPSFAISGNG